MNKAFRFLLPAVAVIALIPFIANGKEIISKKLSIAAIPTDDVKTVEVTKFELPSIVWGGPNELVMQANNTGTMYFDSEGFVEIKPMIGSTKIIQMGKHTLMPGTPETYTATWSSKYPFGYYTLKAEAKGGDDKLVGVSKTLLAIPIVVAGPVLLLLIILIYLFIKMKKRKDLETDTSHLNYPVKPIPDKIPIPASQPVIGTPVPAQNPPTQPSVSLDPVPTEPVSLPPSQPQPAAGNSTSPAVEPPASNTPNPPAI